MLNRTLRDATRRKAPSNRVHFEPVVVLYGMTINQKTAKSSIAVHCAAIPGRPCRQVLFLLHRISLLLAPFDRSRQRTNISAFRGLADGLRRGLRGPLWCRFLGRRHDGGAVCAGRRRRSAQARSRGRCGPRVCRSLWGFADCASAGDDRRRRTGCPARCSFRCGSRCL